MKKIFALILAAALSLSLASCGKNKAVQEVDDKITAIGEVTLDSEDAISAAEIAMKALNEEDREQLENVDILTQARADYDALVKEAQVDEIEAMIDAIGTVTLNSGDAIEAAERKFNSAPAEVQDLVANASVLDEARTALTDLQTAYMYAEADAETVNRVESLINGKYWLFSLNYGKVDITYKLEFSNYHSFELSTSLGTDKFGTYSVRNAYIVCTYPGMEDRPVEIPYTLTDDGIDLNVFDAFDVRK